MEKKKRVEKPNTSVSSTFGLFMLAEGGNPWKTHVPWSLG